MVRYGRETLAVARRILTELVRRKRSLIFWAMFPVLVLLLNGYMMAEWAQVNEANAFELSAPATLVGAALFFSCLGGSISTVVGEREQQTLKRLFISPLSGTSYFLGIFLAHTLIGVGQSLLVYTTAMGMGAIFEGSPALIILVILLSIISYVGVGFILGTQFARRTEDVNSLVAAFGVPLLILGGAFVPSQFFPENLADLAEYNPIYHMIQALTQASTSRDTLTEVADHLQFLMVFAIAMVLTGWLAYRRMMGAERRL